MPCLERLREIEVLIQFVPIHSHFDPGHRATAPDVVADFQLVSEPGIGLHELLVDVTESVEGLPGDMAETISVPVGGDNKFEPTETFAVLLSAPVNASLSNTQALGTILNDDPQPDISINDVTLAEGNSGPTAFHFTLGLTNPSSQTITVQYTTANGTATTADSDYVPQFGIVTFLPGQISQTIVAQVVGDNKFEADETFTIDLSAPVNASASDRQGLGTILNDDVQPAASIDDVTLAEGNAGGTAFTFNIGLTNPSFQQITLNYTTNDGSAQAGDADYVPQSGTVTFLPGQTSQTITIQVNGDNKFEPTETFTVDLSAPRMPRSVILRASARSSTMTCSPRSRLTM